jgi:hypothetical protein
MRIAARFSIRSPRATFLMASLAVLSLFVATRATKADLVQINLAGVLNNNMNSPGEYNGDFRTGNVVNDSVNGAMPVVAGPPGLVFAIPTVGNNAYNTAVGAPVTGNVTSPNINIGVGGVTTVFALVNSVWGSPGSTATFTFTGSGGTTQTFTLTAGTDFRDFNNDGFSNTTNNLGGANGMVTKQFYGTSAGGAANGQALHRLDLIQFTLNPAFLGQTLTKLVIVDMGAGSIDPNTGVKTGQGSRVFLAGMVVQTSVIPEPGPIALAADAGLAGLVGYRRRFQSVVDGWLKRAPKGG